MKKLVQFPEKFSKPPHCCLVSGRRDGTIVDFGRDYVGAPEPHIYIRASQVEDAARNLLGMVSAKRLAEVEAERDELREKLEDATRRLADADQLKAMEERLRAEVAERYGEAPGSATETVAEQLQEPVEAEIEEATA